MAKKPEQIDKITIIRGVVFDKEVRAVGDVIDLTDDTRHAAAVLIRSGKAVAGAVKLGAPASDRAVKDLDKK